MVDSTIVAGVVTATFRADQRYSWQRSLFNHKEIGYPDGRGQLGSGGHSMAHITINGEILSVSGGDSADKQLLDDFDEIIASNTTTDTIAIFNLVIATGTIILTGWCTGIAADRDAPSGIAHIPITVTFLVETKNTAGIT